MGLIPRRHPFTVKITYHIGLNDLVSNNVSRPLSVQMERHWAVRHCRQPRPPLRASAPLNASTFQRLAAGVGWGLSTPTHTPVCPTTSQPVSNEILPPCTAAPHPLTHTQTHTLWCDRPLLQRDGLFWPMKDGSCPGSACDISQSSC